MAKRFSLSARVLSEMATPKDHPLVVIDNLQMSRTCAAISPHTVMIRDSKIGFKNALSDLEGDARTCVIDQACGRSAFMCKRQLYELARKHLGSPGL
jgi:hypothetical protein